MNAASSAGPNPFAAERERSSSYNTSFWNSNNNDGGGNGGNNENGYTVSNGAYGDNAYDDHNLSGKIDNMNENQNKTNYNSNNSNNSNNNSNNDMSKTNFNNNIYNNNDNISSGNNFSNTRSNIMTNNNGKAVTHADLDWREENLRRKEKELEERRARLNGLKDEIEASNYREDNWPSKCYPITFHSISQEIPPFARPHMRKMYSLVILTFFTFLWNLAAELAIYLESAGGKDEDILWATVFFFAGVFYAWKLWYRQIYYGLRDRKTIKWWCFFVFFIVHIGFACYMAIGIDNGSGAAGFIILFSALQKNAAAGLCVLVAAVLWTLVFLASIFLLKRSWNLYKQKGGLEQVCFVCSVCLVYRIAMFSLLYCFVLFCFE